MLLRALRAKLKKRKKAKELDALMLKMTLLGGGDGVTLQQLTEGIEAMIGLTPAAEEESTSGTPISHAEVEVRAA